MMMNVLGLSVLVTSLAAAGLFSPPSTSTTTSRDHQNTIVKEGHRVVVVEYDEDGHHNTKISISPAPSSSKESDSGGLLNSAKEKIKDAASVLPNMGQGISTGQEHVDVDAGAIFHAPKELICDAYGRCKHKIASTMGKAKEKAQQVIDMEREAIASKRETAAKATDKARDATEKVKETGRTLKEHVGSNVSHAKDTAASYLARFIFMESASLDSFMSVSQLIGFATAYGMSVWITFISSYVLARAMPRQQFAVVQSKIYPVYFRAMSYCIGLAFFSHLSAHRNTLFSSLPHSLQAYNLAASLLILFLNSLYLEPRATKLMFERMKIEKEEGRGREDMNAERGRTTTTTQEHQQHSADPKESTPTTATPTGRGAEQDAARGRIIKLNEKLKKLNHYSSILNILNLMSLTWHLVYLAQRLHRIC